MPELLAIDRLCAGYGECVIGQVCDRNGVDHALWEGFSQPAQVGFEPAHHDRLEIAACPNPVILYQEGT